MRHPEAVKDIWDLLSHFPPQALLTKPSLLHAVLDLVGSPVSQTDIDNDLLGLHPITALKWLEALMRKSIKATEQLLDGRFSARVPAAPKRWAENPNEIDEAADLASKLVMRPHCNPHSCCTAVNCSRVLPQYL